MKTREKTTTLIKENSARKYSHQFSVCAFQLKMVIDSPHAANKYLRRISRDFSTVRRFSNTPAVTPATPPPTTAPSVDGAEPLPSTPRGIRKRQRLRKRSSVSSTLSKVLILNVRDLLRAQADTEPTAEVLQIETTNSKQKYSTPLYICPTCCY